MVKDKLNTRIFDNDGFRKVSKVIKNLNVFLSQSQAAALMIEDNLILLKRAACVIVKSEEESEASISKAV